VVGEVDDVGLGRLRWVANVRDITAFTHWLAKPLDILGDELGTHLAVVATEVPIGGFRLDIQALDEQGRTVIIGNQLEPGGHAHFGQLVVYASGVDASAVVWVATRMRADYRRSGVAQQQHTTRYRFSVGIVIGAVRIGDSPAASRCPPMPSWWVGTVCCGLPFSAARHRTRPRRRRDRGGAW
jgi:hypothetical protein